MKHNEELRRWQERFERAKSACAGERNRMDHRESRYIGTPLIVNADGTVDTKSRVTHVRNVVQEIIETQVDSNIPQPKVTAVHEEDRWLADLLEDFLRNELNRLPVEKINDEAERICPTQGGVGILVGWDGAAGSHDNPGAVTLTLEHPKRIIPQDGIYQIADMDWFFLEEPVTRRYVKQRYGVDLEHETESDPNVKSGEDVSVSEDLVTLRTAYFKNDSGGIGRCVWVNDMKLESLEDYQSRRVQRCKKCGAPGNGVRCARCGGTKFREEVQDFRELEAPLSRTVGEEIPAESQSRDEYGQPVFQNTGEPDRQVAQPYGGAMQGMMPQRAGVFTVREEPVMAPTRIPYYKPDVYPLVMRKNISRYGHFLGVSDAESIESHQNTLNKLTTKINQKTLGGGSFATKPKTAKFMYSDEDGKVLELESPKDRELIGVYNLQVDTSSDRALENDMYEQARQVIGITNSMQGREDPTATSAVAKQFSAQQSAGRMESKKTMKRAAFQEIFELIFKFWLAYTDAPVEVTAEGEHGDAEYCALSPWDFLKQDAAGQWYWNTDFLFSCDTSAPLAGSREALWQETRMNYQQGSYGSLQDPATLLLFWTIMEKLQYPMAGTAKKAMQRRVEQQVEQLPQTAQPPTENTVPEDTGQAVLPETTMGNA